MSLISPNFDVKSIIFPNFGQGPFPKIVRKSTDLFFFFFCPYNYELRYKGLASKSVRKDFT